MTQDAKIDFIRFDIATLLMVHRVLETRNLSHAARELGISQPSISNGMKRVRKTFGDPLITRGKQGMMLTSRGEILLEQLRDVVPKLAEIAQPAEFDPATSNDLFHIATSEHAGLVLVPEIIKLVRVAAPNVRIAVTIVHGGQSIDHDRPEHNLRLGWLATLPQYWTARRLIDDEIVVICGDSAPYHHATFGPDDFASAKHVAAVTEAPRYRSIADKTLGKAGLKRDVAAWATSFTSIPLIVENTDLIALCPLSLALRYRKFADLKIMKVPADLGEYYINMAWHPRLNADPGYVWLRMMIVKAAAKIGNYNYGMVGGD